MGTEPEPITLSQVVRRAVEACDSDDEALVRLLERFEDADEPVTAVEDVEARLSEPDAEDLGRDPAVAMAIATAVYLAHRRDMLDALDDDLLRTTARAEWDGNPPESVATWLAERGVEA